MSSEEKKKDLERICRNFDILLYPDCDEHKKALDVLLAFDSKYTVTGILHDRDIYDEESESHKIGDFKKPHWHLVVEMKNQTTRNALSKKLGINKTALEPVESLKGSKKYLLHLENDDKALYDISECFGNGVESLAKLLDIQADENEKAYKIINFIDNYNGYLSMSELSKFCCNNRLWSVFRRSQYVINTQRIEHNENL